MFRRLSRSDSLRKKGSARMANLPLSLTVIGAIGISLFAGYTVWPSYVVQAPLYGYPAPLPPSPQYTHSGSQNPNVNVRVNNSAIVTGDNYFSSIYQEDGCTEGGCSDHNYHGGLYRSGEVLVVINQMANVDVGLYSVRDHNPAAPYVVGGHPY